MMMVMVIQASLLQVLQKMQRQPAAPVAAYQFPFGDVMDQVNNVIFAWTDHTNMDKTICVAKTTQCNHNFHDECMVDGWMNEGRMKYNRRFRNG
eukprot:scaffold798_cov79-Cylindrotheca_fusiformis.AAC.5